MLIKLIQISLVLFALAHIQAQTDSTANRRLKNVQFGGGMLSYKGDLSPNYQQFGSGICFGVNFKKKKNFNGDVLFSYGTVIGQNYDYVFKNSSALPVSYFKAQLISIQYNLSFYFIQKPKLEAYISQGIGVLKFDAKDEFGVTLQSRINTRDKGENFNNNVFMFPSSIGLNYKIFKSWKLGVQVSVLRPNTDYIDNLSKLSTSNVQDNVLSIRTLLQIPIKISQGHQHKTKNKQSNTQRTIIITE